VTYRPSNLPQPPLPQAEIAALEKQVNLKKLILEDEVRTLESDEKPGLGSQPNHSTSKKGKSNQMQAPRQGLLPSAPASSGGLHPPSTAASSTASSRKERLEAMLRREVGSKPKPKPNPNPDSKPNPNPILNLERP